MDYIVVRPIKQNNYAVMGIITLSDRLIDDDLQRGAYVPLNEVQGLDEEVIPGLTFQDYLMKNLDLIIQESIPVLRYAAKQWRVWIPPPVVGKIRLAQFSSNLEKFMLSYCALSERIKITLEAEEALYRLADVVGADAYAIKATTWNYLKEEEEAGRCSLNGWEKFRHLADSFLLRRLFPKFNQTETSHPAILDDLRSVFNVILLTRMLRQQKTLVAKYEKDIAAIDDVDALVDYFFPNPIKPR